ncbi:MAG: hypothetical protein HPY57_13770 [Ignavibacteria bacterium]|nr:hypothetical protein [Ignavibacteria bacterium]
MAKVDNFSDLTIRWQGHPKYRSNKIIEDQILEVIVQKLEMLLFTSENEVYGQDSVGFGIGLEKYLWETRISNSIIENKIRKAITNWIPELDIMSYDLVLKIFEGTVRDIMELNFTIKGYNVTFIFD